MLDLVANNSRMSPSEKINYLYLAGLSRKPNSTEIELANALLGPAVETRSPHCKTCGGPC